MVGMRFVQYQLGHEHAATTGIYQFVSDDFRRSTLRRALDRTVQEAMARKTGIAAPPNVVSLDRSVRPRRANILDE